METKVPFPKKTITRVGFEHRLEERLTPRAAFGLVSAADGGVFSTPHYMLSLTEEKVVVGNNAHLRIVNSTL